MLFRRPLIPVDVAILIGHHLQHVVRVHRRIFLEQQRHRLTWLPARAADQRVLTRRVIVLVRLDRREPVLLRSARAAARHERVAVVVERTAHAEGAGLADLAGRNERAHAVGVRVREDCGQEEIGRRHPGAGGEAARHDHAGVMGQQHGGMTRTGLAHLRGHRFEGAGERIVHLRRGQVRRAAVAAGHEDAPLEHGGGRRAGTGRRHGARAGDGTRCRVEQLRGCQHRAVGGGAAHHEHGAVLQGCCRMPRAGHRQGASNGGDAGGDIEDLDVARGHAVHYAADDNHAAVRKDRRRRVHARGRELARRREGVQGGIVDDHTGGGRAVLELAAGDERQSVGQRDRCGADARVCHGARCGPHANRLRELGLYEPVRQERGQRGGADSQGESRCPTRHDVLLVATSRCTHQRLVVGLVRATAVPRRARARGARQS